MLGRLIALLHRWAESGWAGAATATWEFLQSSVVPGPSGTVFAPLVVADPDRAPRLALWATLGAILGGCVAYLIGARGFSGMGHAIMTTLGVSEARLVRTEAMFAHHGALLVFISTISPLSTKLTCIAAGAFGLALPQFLPSLIVGRIIRFAMLAVLLRLAGERVQTRLLGKSQLSP